jgi:predicted ATPase
MEWHSFPTVYEINTWAWLDQLRRQSGQPLTLRSVPDVEIERLVALGFDAVWLMGVWQRSPAARKIAREHPKLEGGYRDALPDYRPEDVAGSPYAVQSYHVDPFFGGDDDLASLRDRFSKAGLGLILDFVCNHLARDHAWVKEHPERFLGGSPKTLQDQPESYFTSEDGRIFAYGRDPHLDPWTDTLQLDYRRPDTRQAMAEVLELIAGRCDGVRCDMAMLLIRDVFLETWGGACDPPGCEFWPWAIERAKAHHPDLLLVGEAYWGYEPRLQQLGFDFTYDKELYDLLVRGAAAAEVWSRLLDPANGDPRRMVRFVENHDERRALEAFGGVDRSLSAATLALGLPGMRLFHEGQLEGARRMLPVQLGRRAPEPADESVARFYRHLLQALRERAFHGGEWSKVEVLPVNQAPGGALNAGAESSGPEQVVAFQWTMGDERRVVAVNLSPQPARCRLHLDTPGCAGASRWRDLLGTPEAIDNAGDLAAGGLEIELPAYGRRLLAREREQVVAAAATLPQLNPGEGERAPAVDAAAAAAQFGVPLVGWRLVRIFVASPGDVSQERECLDEVILELQGSVCDDRQLELRLKRWEKAAYPGFHPLGPQGLIDAIMHPADCEIFILIFARRFGTPTLDAAGGSEHEFRLAYEEWKQRRRPQIMVYFDEEPPVHLLGDDQEQRRKEEEQRRHDEEQRRQEEEQWKKVRQFRDDFPVEGLWWPYQGLESFRELVRQHLTRLIKDLVPVPQKPSPPQRRGIGPELNAYVQRPKLETEIVELLSAEGGRPHLVTLHGAGGMGKTRLARACGARLQAQGTFLDGVFFVSLDGVERSVEAVAEAIASELSIKSVDGLFEELLSYLRNRRLLLILDNYESVAAQRIGACLKEVLTKAAEVRLLVTGRQPVNLGALEQEIDLDEGLDEAEARELFIARAGQRKATWTLEPGEEDALGRIMALTERIPLAIEFAAAWVGKKSVAEIAGALAEPGGGDPPPGLVEVNARHASLWHCQDWSFRLLKGEQQEVFVQLGIFAETFTLEAAARVCSLSDQQVRGVVFELQDSALIRRFGRRNVARYGMPKFTREYAAEKLRSDQRSWSSMCHSFVDLYSRQSNETVLRADAAGATPEEILGALAWIDMEWRNLRAAEEHAVAERSWGAVESLSGALLFFLQRRGRLQEGEELFQNLLNHMPQSVPGDLGDAAGRGTILNALGVVCQFRRELDRAEKFLRESCELRQGSDRAKTLNSLGTVYQTLGRWLEAKRCHEESLALSREFHDLSEEAKSLNNLGPVYGYLGDLKAAQEALELSLNTWRFKLGDPRGEADALNGLGVIYQRRENWVRAHEEFTRRLEKLKTISDRVGQARTLSSLGYVDFRHGQSDDTKRYLFNEAATHLTDALEICREVEDTVEEGEVYRNLGELFEARANLAKAAEEATKDFARAAVYLENSWRLRQGVERAQTLNKLGWIYERHGQKESAIECYRRAVNLTRSRDPAEAERSRQNLERVLGPAPSLF